MKINEDFKLESDSMNITLFERVTAKAKPDKPSHDYWVTVGYFSCPENALKFLVDHKIRGDGFKDLQKITKRQQELYDMIQNLSSETLRATTECLNGEGKGIVPRNKKGV